ncbi:unnamed protein product [Coffea canephora]|uniref:RING-type E3 ubiquitin transferase n=1 Tax=Coffea canephora TaxID=49390 RepID=A0A068V4H5_COFCA|nr:unnamed protein product [Coffea canephora]
MFNFNRPYPRHINKRYYFLLYNLILFCSFVKRLESINTVISSVWWVFGFYWIYMGGKALLQDSPRLYWLSVVFLAFDVFFMIFCIAMAFIFFVLLASLFKVSDRKLLKLSSLLFLSTSRVGLLLKTKHEYNEPLTKIAQFPKCGVLEKMECCICLHGYEDGVEVCTLPCNHHFHYRCIRRWLRINATCPLCKFNILQGEMLV